MTPKHALTGLIFILMCVAVGSADTFKSKETGESFNGFATQATINGHTRVFSEKENGFVNILLDDYEVTYNALGRKDRAALAQITKPEILLSEKISAQIAEEIKKISNLGYQLIILQIDCPGGKSEYMKNIANALLETTNCPTVAFISGGEYGGAFSTAAALAMACDKVYIAPAGVMGSIGPAPENLSQEGYVSYLKTYSPESLSGPYMVSYLKNMAQQTNRPELLVRALVDKSVSVVEVVNQNGQQQFIQREDQQSNQTVIRTLTEGMNPDIGDTVSPSDLTGSVLTLTSTEAIDIGLADGTAASVKEIIAALGLEDIRIGNIPGIDKLIDKYLAGRRNIAKGLSDIQYLEEQASRLESQFDQLVDQAATATQTRSVSTGGRAVYSSRDRRGLPSITTRSDSYGGTREPAYKSSQERQMRSGTSQQSIVTTEESLVSITTVQNQLAIVLRELISSYRKVGNLAKRWPGGLPPEVTLEMLQENLDSTTQQLERLSRYQPMIPNQNTTQRIR